VLQKRQKDETGISRSGFSAFFPTAWTERMSLTVFCQHRARLEEGNDAWILLERAGDLFPRDELGHLFRQLPELLEVDVAVWQSANAPSFNLSSSMRINWRGGEAFCVVCA